LRKPEPYSITDERWLSTGGRERLIRAKQSKETKRERKGKIFPSGFFLLAFLCVPCVKRLSAFCFRLLKLTG
jgi:hypothetical protein